MVALRLPWSWYMVEIESHKGDVRGSHVDSTSY